MLEEVFTITFPVKQYNHPQYMMGENPYHLMDHCTLILTNKDELRITFASNVEKFLITITCTKDLRKMIHLLVKQPMFLMMY